MKRIEVEPLPSHIWLKKWILGLWILALTFVVGFSVYFMQEDHQHPAFIPTSTDPSAAPENPTPTIPPSKTPQPSPTYTTTPGITPSPTSSATPSLTPTDPRRFIIGTSVSGRPLEVFQFGHGDTARMIVAGIHGGYEWNTIALAEELISHLEGQSDFIPPHITLYVLPSLNPDGAARSRGIRGRANDNGVDLNRNFPDHWQANWPLQGCWSYMPISAGTHPASEPETQALVSFIQTHAIDALISYHSAALGIFAGGQPPTENSLSLAEEIASVSNYPYPPLDLGCKFTGQLIDWAASTGIAAVDIELSNHKDTDFKQNLSILSTFLHWKARDQTSQGTESLLRSTPQPRK